MKLSLRLPRLDTVREALRSRAGSLRGMRLLARREVLFIAAVAVASAVITLIVLNASFHSAERRAAAQSMAPAAAHGGAALGTGQARQGAAASSTEGELSPDDFLLPAVPAADQPPDYYPFRPRLQKWSRENVQKFWVSPRQIATDTIGILNDRNMESMFEKVK